MKKIYEEERNGTRWVWATDEPGSGGANHEYFIEHMNRFGGIPLCRINFQNGPILEAGVNGVHNEDLLAIVQHRLECFQSGPFRCDENEAALNRVREALAILEDRTARRVLEGTEGTNKGN